MSASEEAKRVAGEASPGSRRGGPAPKGGAVARVTPSRRAPCRGAGVEAVEGAPTTRTRARSAGGRARRSRGACGRRSPRPAQCFPWTTDVVRSGSWDEQPSAFSIPPRARESFVMGPEGVEPSIPWGRLASRDARGRTRRRDFGVEAATARWRAGVGEALRPARVAPLRTLGAGVLVTSCVLASQGVCQLLVPCESGREAIGTDSDRESPRPGRRGSRVRRFGPSGLFYAPDPGPPPPLVR